MNLLPNTEKDLLKKGLKLRSLVLTLILVTSALICGLIMLLPPYFLTKDHFLSAVSSQDSQKIGETEEENDENIPEEIESKLKFLQSHVSTRSAVTSISKALDSLSGGVTVRSVAFIRSQTYKGKVGTVIQLSGSSADRESLVSFSNAIKDSKQFTSVDMPVSNLTKEKDLPFSVTIFIANQ